MGVKKAFLLFLLFSLVFMVCVSCELNAKPEEKKSEPVTPAPEPETETPSYSIIGTWHYTYNNEDAYIQFKSDGTGWIHYYQYYGSIGGNLNTYINLYIKNWEYYKESASLLITIAGNNIGGISTDRGPFRYVVSELTETTLYITTNGAYDSAVPTKKDSDAREMKGSMNENYPVTKQCYYS